MNNTDEIFNADSAISGENNAGAVSLINNDASAPNNDDMARTDVEKDKIQIADDVLIQIISIAASKINGISIPSSSVGDGIAGLLGMKGSSRGIRVEMDENGVSADISINVEYGLKINEIAKSLQDAIRGDLTDMTGLNIVNVNVHVVSVNIKEPPAVKSAKAVKQQKEPGEGDTEGVLF